MRPERNVILRKALSKKVRLNKWIAQTSELSRRAADDAILKGRVTVNGAKVESLGLSIDPSRDAITLDGRPLKPVREAMYIAFYKPRGYLVTKDDPQGRPTIWNILKKFKTLLNAVGRLDMDSEGLLLLTNDGDTLYRLTHPSHEIWKTYEVKVGGVPSEEAIAKLKSGIDLLEGRTSPAEVRVLKKMRNNTWLEIKIREGRYRQVRRMCEAVGHSVVVLKRVAVGSIKLGFLKPGKWRDLKPYEIRELSVGY